MGLCRNDAFDMPWRIERLRVDELTLRDISLPMSKCRAITALALPISRFRPTG